MAQSIKPNLPEYSNMPSEQEKIQDSNNEEFKISQK